MGKLLGVSAQTVYHWDTGKTKPRASQLQAISAARKMGKKAVTANWPKSRLRGPEFLQTACCGMNCSCHRSGKAFLVNHIMLAS